MVFFLILVMYRYNYSYINIYPYKVYLDVEKNRVQDSIVFYNKTTAHLRYKLSIKDKKLKKVISFYPQVVTVSPGDEKEINLKLESNWVDLEKIEHKSEILIEQLKVPIKDETGRFIKSSGVEIYPKVKIPLKIYLGKAPIKLKIVRDLIVQNISEREINVELFLITKMKDEKNRLKFLKSIKLANLEEINLKEETVLDSLESIEIYEKESGKKIEII